MSYTAKDYTTEITKNATWEKVFSPANLNKLLDFLEEHQWLPSQVTIDRALAQLQFRRTDGGSAASDQRAAIGAAQKNLEAVIAEAALPTLTRTELEEFASLSAADLQSKYWGPDNDGITVFAVRYNKAAQQHGFRVPPRPQVVEEIDDSKELRLSASEYHSLSANQVCRRLQTEPPFKRAVDRLIKAGAIALVLGLLHGGLI
jgi:hypothetical protein